ncbi:MAG: erythromycin esterase family protein [Pseudomonadales bacterium]
MSEFDQARRTMLDAQIYARGVGNVNVLNAMAEVPGAPFVPDDMRTYAAVVWHHNSHIGDARATEFSSRSDYSIGQLCAKAFASASYRAGFGTDHGSVAAAPNGDAPMQVQAAHRQSYEYIWFDSKSAITPLKTRTLRGLPDTYPFGV